MAPFENLTTPLCCPRPLCGSSPAAGGFGGFRWRALFGAPSGLGLGPLLFGLIDHQLNRPPVQHLGDIAVLVVKTDRPVDVGQIDGINRM